MKVWALVLAATMVMAAGFDAEAARLGGGRSMGRQSSNVTQRQAAPAPVAPSQSATNAAPSAPAAAPAAAPRRPWGAMLGGLAAGAGLAWLAHSMGLGAEMGQFLMIGLVVLAGMLLWGFIRSRKAASNAPPPSPFAFQGAAAPSAAPTYSPDHVGNDASARPFERSSHMAPLESGGSMIGSALAGPQGWGAPAGFDSEGFLRAAKNNFITLQSAWDRSDISSLRAMMTDTMLGEIQSQLTERETHTGGNTNKTDVVMLDAKLLGIEDLGNDYMASVEFSGMIREEPSAGPSPFREVWNMTKPKSGASGWLVAGVQALQ
ncbi:Tim44 domain-containing protein [Rhodoferax sp. WC2427]|uniref:Tim44 domain-containing protein n=1 Tax=Rhodoferax sp. WC2427 TaxID=3234144 RepID=UPI0034661D67